MSDVLNSHQLNWEQWQYVPTEGFTIRGWRTSPRGLPVIHFIHGNSYSGLTYMPLWEQLGEQFDIVLHDIQGHGDSDTGGRFVGWNRSAEIAIEAWKTLAPDYKDVPLYGSGHSFGGVLTSLMTAAEPGLFEQQVLLDPIIMPPQMLMLTKPLELVGLYGYNPIARKSKRRRSVWRNPEEALSSLKDRGMFKGWTDESLKAYVRYNMQQQGEDWSLKCPPAREAELFSSYANNLWTNLKQLNTPTHALIGQETYPFVLKAAEYWQRCNPAMRFEVVPGSHCFMLQYPQQTATQVAALLPDSCQKPARSFSVTGPS